MASLRSVRLAARSIPPSLPVSSRTRVALQARPLALHQPRSFASKGGEGKKKNDDLGGLGGQEPDDPTERARQNAGYGNSIMLSMVILSVPLYYVTRRPEKTAKALADPRPWIFF